MTIIFNKLIHALVASHIPWSVSILNKHWFSQWIFESTAPCHNSITSISLKDNFSIEVVFVRVYNIFWGFNYLLEYIIYFRVSTINLN